MNRDQLAYPWENQASSPDRGILAGRPCCLVQASTTSCTKLSREALGLELVPREGRSGTRGRAGRARPGVTAWRAPSPRWRSVRLLLAGAARFWEGVTPRQGRAQVPSAVGGQACGPTQTASGWGPTVSSLHFQKIQSGTRRLCQQRGKKAQKSVFFFFFFFSHEELGLGANQDKGGSFYFSKGVFKEWCPMTRQFTRSPRFP